MKRRHRKIISLYTKSIKEEVKKYRQNDDGGKLEIIVQPELTEALKRVLYSWRSQDIILNELERRYKKFYITPYFDCDGYMSIELESR